MSDRKSKGAGGPPSNRPMTGKRTIPMNLNLRAIITSNGLDCQAV